MDTLSDALNYLEGISLSQFADDGVIWTKHTSAELAVKKLQKALDIVEDWSTFWGFKVSPDKTKAIIFSRKKKKKKKNRKKKKTKKKKKTLKLIASINTKWQKP